MSEYLKLSARRIALFPVVCALSIALLIAPAYAFEFDQDSVERYLQGYWWMGDSVLFLDAGQGGWVYNGQSTTSRSTSLTYISARSKGEERCTIGGQTVTDWNDYNYSYSLAAVYGYGSGYSSIANCSWIVWSPCKVFSTDGDHRADYNNYYDTSDTEAWIVEPVCGD